MSMPRWFAQLKWEGPFTVADLNNGRRGDIPEMPGCYVFTIVDAPPRPTQTLYVGLSKNLSGRLPTYLVHDIKKNVPSRGKHKGKLFLLGERENRTDYGVWVQWAVYAGEIRILEASLINYLNPDYNSRDEDTMNPLFGDDELLEPYLIR